MNAPKCIKCQLTCWFDKSKGTYSSYCGNTCRLGQVSQPVQYYQPTTAKQGQFMCRICSNAAFYDGRKFSPGCGRTHATQAIAMGFTTPRQ